jgi:hypothetical protein
MTVRLFRQHAQGYGSQPTNVTVKIDGVDIYSGSVSTINTPVPCLPDSDVKINNVAWGWDDTAEFAGTRELSISVSGSPLLLAETLANNPHAGNIQPEMEWLAFYCKDINGVKYFDPLSNQAIDGVAQRTAAQGVGNTGQQWWIIDAGSTFTATVNVDAVELPTESAQLKPVVKGKVYHWIDMAPTIDLSALSGLDIETKRSRLFGRCDVDQWIYNQTCEKTVLFDTYIDLDLKSQNIEKLFFPSLFLSQCQIFKQYISKDWHWDSKRKHAVACAMRIPRPSRFIASCWLANHADQVDFVYTQNWQQDQCTDRLSELLDIGGVKHAAPLQLPYRAVGQLPQDGSHAYIHNFKILYHGLFKDSAAAVVTSAVFWEHGSELCEKYLNAVYSGCIPLLQGYKIYNRLQAMGFDVFDDVIDTSSQWDTNPVTAAWNLWERNTEFFKNAQSIVQRPDIQRRLRNNFQLLQNGAKLFDNIINQLNEKDARSTFLLHQSDILEYLENWHGVDHDPAMRPRLREFIAGV